MNNRIAEIGGEERLDKLDFFCECGSEDCVASVEISVEDYAQTAEASFILADGHDPAQEDVAYSRFDPTRS